MKSISKKYIFWLIVIVIVIVVVIFLRQVYFVSPEEGAERIGFMIQEGESADKIGAKLEEKQLIKSKLVFDWYVYLRRAEKKFQVGQFNLMPGMSLKELVDILTQEGENEMEITIIEGWNTREIGQYFENSAMFQAEEILEITGFPQNMYGAYANQFEDEFSFLKEKPSYAGLEGFLFPDTYRIYRQATTEETIKKILKNFDRKIDEKLREDIKNSGHSLYQVLILASIIEREVSHEEDRAIVSDIFWRRLGAGIPLQADSTVNYITGNKSRRLSTEELAINSPYNTYKYRGLPPTPISNPGLSAIRAAIYPKSNSYWYFLSSKDGTTYFAGDFKEHQQNREKFLD